MKHFNITFLFVLSILCPVVFAQVGEVPKPESQPEKYVSTVLTPQDVRILKIDYPCDVHPTASVEVRVLDDKTAKDPTLTNPVFLQNRWINRSDLRNIRLRDAIDLCYLEDEDDMLLRVLKFENPETTMSVLGWIGAFGVRDVVVRVKMENPKTGEEETTLVFPNASRTTVGKMPTKTDPYSTHAFGFDLVGKEFDLPCNLMVWVVRGEKILLQEIVHWDGRMANPYENQGINVRHEANPNKKKDDFFDDGDDDDDEDAEEDEEDEEKKDDAKNDDEEEDEEE